MNSKFVIMFKDADGNLKPAAVSPEFFCGFLNHLESEHPDYAFFDFPNDFCTAQFYFCGSVLVAFCFLDSDCHICQIKNDIALDYSNNN